MLHRLTKLALIISISVSALAGLELETLPRDMKKANTLVTKPITFKITGDDFPSASPSSPVYVQLFLSEGRLLDTMVSTADSVWGHRPINLAAWVQDYDDTSTLNWPSDAVSITRWVSGENAIWLKIQASTSTAVSTNGIATSPSQERPLVFHLGMGASESETTTAHLQEANVANLKANSRPDGRMTATNLFVDRTPIGSGIQLYSDGLYLGMTVFDHTSLFVESAVDPNQIVPGQMLLGTYNFPYALGTYVNEVPSKWLYHTTPNGAAYTTKLHFRNAGFQEEVVRLTAYDQDGYQIDEAFVTVARRENQVLSMTDLFNGNVSHLRIEDAQTTAVSAGYRIATGRGATAHVNAEDKTGLVMVLFPGEKNYTFDGMAMVNRGDEATGAVAHFFGEGRTELGSAQLAPSESLQPLAKKLFLLDSLAPSGTVSIEIYTDQPCGFVFLRGTRPGVSPGYLYQVQPQDGSAAMPRVLNVDEVIEAN